MSGDGDSRPLIDVDAQSAAYHGGGLRLRGSGFTEGALTIHFGATALVDPGSSSGPDVFFGYAQENDAIQLTVPSAAWVRPEPQV